MHRRTSCARASGRIAQQDQVGAAAEDGGDHFKGAGGGGRRIRLPARPRRAAAAAGSRSRLCEASDRVRMKSRLAQIGQRLGRPPAVPSPKPRARSAARRIQPRASQAFAVGTSAEGRRRRPGVSCLGEQALELAGGRTRVRYGSGATSAASKSAAPRAAANAARAGRDRSGRHVGLQIAVQLHGVFGAAQQRRRPRRAACAVAAGEQAAAADDSASTGRRRASRRRAS